MGNKGGNSGGGTSNSTTSSRPWQGLVPYLKDLYSGATTAQGNTPTAPWGGPLVSRPRPETIAGQDEMLQLANSFQGAGTGTMQLASDMISGKYLDPNKNPFFGGAVQAALHPVEDQFYNTTLPSISDTAIQQGAYGGDREGITKALASSDFTRNMGDITSKMSLDNYQAERQLQMYAPTLMSAGENLNMLPSQIYGQIGKDRQQTEQDMLTEAGQLYQNQQTAPWTGMDMWSKILQGGGAGNAGSSNSSTTNPQGGTPSWVQGALGGAGLGASIGNMAGLTGWGLGGASGGGAALGLLLGLL